MDEERQAISLRATNPLLLLLLATATGWCEHYRFHHFGPEDGLSASVSAVLQDHTGFLWIGTANGLFRYDGARFQPFGPDEGLPAPGIRALAESPEGTLWVITARGLARLHGDWFEAIDTGAPPQELLSLAIAPSGRIYVGAVRGLFSASVSGSAARPEFVPVAGVAPQRVEAILALAGDTAWFGCADELCLLGPAGIRRFGASSGLPAGPWKALVRDRDGTLWVRSAGRLYALPRGAAEFTARDHDLPPSKAGVALIEDRGGGLWTSSDSGVARWRGSGWRIAGPAEGLASGAVTALWADREGSLWIGLAGTGIARWPQPFQWTNWTVRDGLPDVRVSAVMRQDAGLLWVGTARGLTRFGGGATRTWSRQSGLAGDRVTALAAARDGSVWAAFSPGGITRIAPGGGSVRSYSGAAGLEDTRVNAIAFDPGEHLWVATEGGVFRGEGQGAELRFERMKVPGAAGSPGYPALAAERGGTLWLAAPAGLLRWDDGAWTRIGTAEGLLSNAVNRVLDMKDQSLWISYFDPLGLSRISLSSDGWRVQPAPRESGLPSSEIRFLGRDALGQLWAGTDRGIAFGAPGKWHTWTHEDGLLSDEAAPNSFFAGADGTVWVGTAAGLARFTPARGDYKPEDVRCVITEVNFGGHRRSVPGPVTVPYADNDFSAVFTGLNLSGHTLVKLRYRLWGRDANWTETVQPTVRYCNLPAGTYRFEVQARAGSGAWSTQSAVAGFRILPGWWQTWWFSGALALGAATLFYGALHWSVIWARRGDRYPTRAAPLPVLVPTPAPVGLPHPVNLIVDAPKKNLRILLAEDDPINQNLAQKVLEKMGHNVVVAGDGAEAVRAHAAGAFDLVLMDLQMPEMDGFAATNSIRAFEAAGGERIPIVGVTANAGSSDRDLCLASGMDDFISKPLNLVALGNLIDRVAEQGTSAGCSVPVKT